MQDIILHIGLPKTGSTYLQHWLSLNRGALMLNGLGVHALPGFGHSVREEFENYLADGGRLPENAIDIGAEFASNGGSLPVISSEGFWRHKPADVKRFLELKNVRVSKVVVFLRRQDRLEASLYNQRVKVRGFRDRFSPGDRRLDYLALWEAWANAFGNENIVAIDYDNAVATDKIENIFLECIGYPRLCDPVAPRGALATNPSPDAALLEIIRLNNLRGHPPMVNPLKEYVLRHLKPGPAFGIDQESASRVEEIWIENNRKLAERLGGADFQTLTTPGWKTKGLDLSGKDVSERLIELIAVLADASSSVWFSALDRDLVPTGSQSSGARKKAASNARADELAARAGVNSRALRQLCSRAERAGIFECNSGRADATPAGPTEPALHHSTFNEMIDLAAYATSILRAKQEMNSRKLTRGHDGTIGMVFRAIPTSLRKNFVTRPDLLLKKAYSRARFL
ncbi:MAG: hypothetical protein H6883_03750 [Rhodobiaceae bacterium]|nr:hypothetical protein [Rhodobiaceae bacterium]MCC0055231.1 hypothetical protein [Rhodobiaceae bacterium]